MNIQHTFSDNEIEITGKKWFIDGEVEKLDFLAVTHQNIYGPSCLYLNGRTYLTMKRHTYNSDSRPAVIEYYNGNMNFVYMDRNPTDTDRHNSGVLSDDGSGRLILFFEQHDPAITEGRVETWRMANPYDNNSWVYKGLSPEFGTYPKPFSLTENRFVLFGRKDPLNVSGDGNIYIIEYDGDTTWSTPVRMTEHAADPLGGERYYPTYLQGGENSDGWRYLHFSKRVGETFNNNHWYREKYLIKFKKSDPYDIYNMDESFHKKVDISGFITQMEFNDNYSYAINTVPAGGNVQGIVDSSGVMVVTIMEDGFNHALNFQRNNILRSEIYKGGLWPFDRYSYLYIDNIAKEYKIGKRISYYRSTPGKSVDYSPHKFWKSALPMNMDKIPKGRKFMIASGTFKSDNSDSIFNYEENDIHLAEVIKR